MASKYAITAGSALLLYQRSRFQEVTFGEREIDVWQVIKNAEVCLDGGLTPGCIYLAIEVGQYVNYCKCEECTDGYFSKHDAYGWDIISRSNQ